MDNERPDQWYRDALDRKWRHEANVALWLTLLNIAKDVALVLGGFSFAAYCAWRLF